MCQMFIKKVKKQRARKFDRISWNSNQKLACEINFHLVQSKFLHRKGIQKYYKYKFFFENVASKQCKFYFWFLLFFRSYSILIWVMYNKCHKNDHKKEEWIEHIYGSLLVSRFRMFGIFVSIHFFSKTGFRLISSTRT